MITCVVVTYTHDSLRASYAGGSVKDAFFIFESLKPIYNAGVMRLELWESGEKVRTIEEFKFGLIK